MFSFTCYINQNPRFWMVLDVLTYLPMPVITSHGPCIHGTTRRAACMKYGVAAADLAFWPVSSCWPLHWTHDGPNNKGGFIHQTSMSSLNFMYRYMYNYTYMYVNVYVYVYVYVQCICIFLNIFVISFLYVREYTYLYTYGPEEWWCSFHPQTDRPGMVWRCLRTYPARVKPKRCKSDK